MSDEKAAQLLTLHPEGHYVMKIKFLKERTEGDWFIEDKFDPVKAQRRKGKGIVVISKDTKPEAFTGIDMPYYENAYPVIAVVYGLYPSETQTPPT